MFIMRLAALPLLLCCSVTSLQNCSYHDVLNHVQLTQKRDLFTLSRPVRNHSHVTEVELDVLVYAILDVREVDQTFISYIWVEMHWKNEFIHWDQEEFCGIEVVAVPIEMLWKPDITIVEMTERDKSSPSPYLHVHSHGSVVYRMDQVVYSTCRMHSYKFPFDTQSCNLSFRSILLSDREIQLSTYSGSLITKWSQQVMRTQYEWVFRNITVSKSTGTLFDYPQETITYTITMKRRSVLYIVNFLLPVVFFLILDLASFLISDTGGEKLGFKITILLAVTVMQLLLNDILPSSSNRIPLIAVFCIGVFSLMLLSLLESLLVLFLIRKDQQMEQDPKRTITQLHVLISQMRGATDFAEEKGSDLALLSQLLQNHENDEILKDPGSWSSTARRIHRVFFIFYTTAAICFLCSIFHLWTDDTL